MKEDIQNFPKQLQFSPEIKNKEKWNEFENYVLIGMGGSHLQGDVFKAIYPDFPLLLHQNYGLPFLRDAQKTGFIAASYSGNTEEVLDAYNMALSSNFPVAVVSKGGKLLADAKEKELPYIELPQDKIEPRIGIGYTYKSLLKMVNGDGPMKDSKEAVENLERMQPDLEKNAKDLVSSLENRIPIIYATQKNSIIAGMWKINFNETTKIPSFYNVVPELNHNEMTGFDVIPSTEKLSEKMIFILLVDREDHPKNQKRLKVLREVLEKRNLEVLEVKVEGVSRTEKVFSGILFSEWMAYYMAHFYNTNYANSPMVEEFKKMI